MSRRTASPAQQRFWFLDQLDGADSTALTLPLCYCIDGALDRDRLAAALRIVIARHEVLRSTYRWEEARLVADVLPPDAIEIREAGSRTTALEEEAVVHYVHTLAEEPFDLARGPLLRSAIVASGPRLTYLALAVHHIVWDGWSWGVLLNDLSVAYSTGGALPELSVGYWDYAERKHRVDDEQRGARDLAFWRERLADREPPARLAHAGPADEDPAAIRRVRVEIDLALKERIVAFGRAHSVTPFSVFAAGLQALLHRMGLESRPSLGIPLADRIAPEYEALIGCFLNTVVLSGSVDGDETFAQLATRARDDTLAALQHRSLPFEVLAKRLTPGRDVPAAELYQALLVFQNYPQATLAIAGCEGAPVTVTHRRGRIDPTITLWFERADPAIDIEWNGTLALPAKRFVDCWLALVAGGIEAPQARVDALPLAATAVPPSAETGRGVSEEPTTVPELLRARARREPDALAVVDGDLELTLSEVMERATQVGERLRSAGVRAGSVVGLAAERGAETIVATLAILDAGATCVPLDRAYPMERLRFMLEDSGAVLVLCEDAAGGVWCGQPALALDGAGTARARPADAPGEGIAWLLYTSGSTGQPKGVRIGHEMVVARLLREPIPWGPDERCCHKTSLSFIDSLWEMLGPLAHGLPTIVADAETARDPRLLASLMERHGVTRVVLVPSLIGALLDLRAEELGRLAGVRYWISSGEALSASLAERFHRALPGTTLVNLYGASECWDVTWHVVPATVRANDAVPIGEPLADVRVWLVDDGLSPVPTDVPGELFVGGPCVARGYRGQAAHTQERFVQAASIERGATGVAYRTGDIARRRDDGSLELLGRRDLQVKMRGFRIELEEIERSLLAASAVTQAAVVPLRDDAGVVASLAAFLVTAPGSELDVPDLRRTLDERLPAHLVPSSFAPLERLPLTPNGKLDRAALAAVAAAAASREAGSAVPEHVSPRTDEERALATIWCEVLGIAPVGATDNFFELGGHSLAAVQVVLRVEEEFGVELPLRDFYERPTIAEMSAALMRR